MSPKVPGWKEVIGPTKRFKPRTCACGAEFLPTSGTQYRCSKCQAEADKLNRRISRQRLIRRKRESRKSWRGGTNWYRTLAKKRGAKCNRCGSKKFLVVHHRDHNHSNNDPSNLEVLCKSCHQKEHQSWRNWRKKKEAEKSGVPAGAGDTGSVVHDGVRAQGLDGPGHQEA